MALNDSPTDVAADSYISLTTAASFLSIIPVSKEDRESWAVLIDSQKEQLLKSAIAVMDRFVTWNGYKTNSERILEWPRDGAYDKYAILIDNATIPLDIKYAQLEIAIWLNANDGAVPVDAPGVFDSVKIGPISIDYNEQVLSSMYNLPPSVIETMKLYGDVNSKSGRSLRTVQLQRT